MEPERNIEKLLRAFAKERREQAGDPFELHPANRRLLQGEVKRKFRSSSERESFLKRLGIRPGFAFAICSVALVCLFAAMLLPALSRAKMKSRSSVARLKEKLENTADGFSDASANKAPVPSAAPVVLLTVSATTNLGLIAERRPVTVTSGALNFDSGNTSSTWAITGVDRLGAVDLGTEISHSTVNSLQAQSGEIALSTSSRIYQTDGDANRSAFFRQNGGIPKSSEAGAITGDVATLNGGLRLLDQSAIAQSGSVRTNSISAIESVDGVAGTDLALVQLPATVSEAETLTITNRITNNFALLVGGAFTNGIPLAFQTNLALQFEDFQKALSDYYLIPFSNLPYGRRGSATDKVEILFQPAAPAKK